MMLQEQGAGGIGAVSAGISETIVEIAIIAVCAVLVIVGLWKLAKVIWAAFSS